MNFLINRKITISMIFIALTFLGYISYKQLKVELLPSTELPTMTVQISSRYSYDPNYIESDIIIPLEGIVAKTSGIEKISSQVNNKGGNIIAEFKPNIDMKTASIKFTKEINQAAKDLPEGFSVNVIRANSATLSSSHKLTRT